VSPEEDWDSAGSKCLFYRWFVRPEAPALYRQILQDVIGSRSWLPKSRDRGGGRPPAKPILNHADTSLRICCDTRLRQNND
jgi:hypothetical protein